MKSSIFWWRPGPQRGKEQFLEGPVKHGDVELTSIRRAPCQRELTSVLRRLLIGPAAGRHRANAARRRVMTSARHRNVTSARRHYPTSGRRRAASALLRPAAGPMSKRRRHDIVPTSIPADVAHVVLASPCFLRVTDPSWQNSSAQWRASIGIFIGPQSATAVGPTSVLPIGATAAH